MALPQELHVRGWWNMIVRESEVFNRAIVVASD